MTTTLQTALDTPETPAAEPVLNPSALAAPAFLLNCPFSYATVEANNAWMQELSPEARTVDRRKALRQWLELYHFLSGEALVYVLPTPVETALQDLTFTANVAMVPEHIPGRDVVIVSNFTSEPRVGEAAVAQRFFEAMGYRTYVAPHKFEGDAEIKHLHDNVYVGGFGIRSEAAAYRWMENTFDMKVIKVRETDDYLYHLDCTIFPLTREDTLVCTEAYKRSEVTAIEKHTNVHAVSLDMCLTGICNSVRLNNTILNASHIHELKANTEEYKAERDKNRRLEDIAVELGLEVSYFNLSEFHKGGALLSCLVMHLNRNSYEFKLL
jgi:N-dimethylarginine dimethylaminohydrolase